MTMNAAEKVDALKSVIVGLARALEAAPDSVSENDRAALAAMAQRKAERIAEVGAL